MEIYNVRMRFCANSSSSHSLIFAKGVKDKIYNSGRYGWDTFTLASRESKAEYMFSLIYLNLAYTVGHDIAKRVASSFTGIPVSRYPEDVTGIDHSSIYNFPLEIEPYSGILGSCKYFPSSKFMEDLTSYILQDGLVILGGNDNGDGEHPLAKKGGNFTLPIPQDDPDTYIARKDVTHNYWTLFNTKNGNKIRMRFGAGEPIVKSEYPELVDMKITDYCDKNCSYCYQDSTTAGGPASPKYISQLLACLGGMGVFEVALGGGDTTSHPDIDRVIDEAINFGMIPNVTISDSRCLTDIRYNRINSCGSITISINSMNSLYNFKRCIENSRVRRDKIGLQCIEGLVEKWELYKIIEDASELNLPLTILGYKDTGRGKDKKIKKYDVISVILDIIKSKGRHTDISFDTLLVNKYRERLEEHGTPRILYDTEEGKYSMYIDAVKKKCAKNSYTENTVDIPEQDVYDSLINIYRSW